MPSDAKAGTLWRGATMAATWKLAKGTTWKQKLVEPHLNHGKVVPVPAGMQKRYGTGTMLIPKPLDVDALIRKVSKGRLATASRIRARLAADSGADQACPFTTGLFVRIAAEAAEEDRRAGKKRITPYWRLVRDDGSLNQKFPGGAKAQATRLRQEGFTVERGRGKKPPRVKDFEKYLAKL
jgi:hypothetical protein